MGMHQKAKVIFNPFSGRWAAQKRLPETEVALNEAGIDYELDLTEAPRHATKIAREAVEAGFTSIIAAGGDGLIGEVVNGLAQGAGDKPWVTLGILPLGTANDLVDNLGLPRNIHEAAQVIAAGNTRQLDVCTVNDWFFLNNAGLGLESYVSVIQNRMTWARGMFRYLFATMLGIARNPQWQMKIEWDSGDYEGPVSLVSISNSPRTGGVFYTVPHADPFDGKLTFTYGFIPTRLEIIKVFPMILKPDEGNYVEHPAVHEKHTKWLKVHAASPTPMHVDGEVMSEAIQELEYQILPQKLPIILGDLPSLT